MDPYVGEIRLFTGNYAPRGWALCNGAILPIQQFVALFSVIGISYGGDGRTTFALPNLSGKVPMGQGAGPGLTPRQIATTVGKAAETLTLDQIPNHTHVPNGTSVSAGSSATADPANAIWGSESPTSSNRPYSANVSVRMNARALNAVGGSSAHNNMQPFLSLNFIIATEGVLPPRG